MPSEVDSKYLFLKIIHILDALLGTMQAHREMIPTIPPTHDDCEPQQEQACHETQKVK